MRWRTIDPVSTGLGGDLAGWDFPVPLRSSDLWQARHLQADSRQLAGVSSNTFRVKHAGVKKRRLDHALEEA